MGMHIRNFQVIIIVVACATTINAALSLVSEEYLLMAEDAKINKYHIYIDETVTCKGDNCGAIISPV